MLYVSAGCTKPVRIQGAYAETEELENAISRVKDSKHDLSNKFVILEFEISEMQSDNSCDFAMSSLNKQQNPFQAAQSIRSGIYIINVTISLIRQTDCFITD